jgi:hypothetical protein
MIPRRSYVYVVSWRGIGCSGTQHPGGVLLLFVAFKCSAEMGEHDPKGHAEELREAGTAANSGEK